MKLLSAMRLESTLPRSMHEAGGRAEILPRLALVGSGGKTTALFLLARQVQKIQGAPPTILTAATTHMAIKQLNLADHYFYVRTAQDVADVGATLPAGVILFISPGVEANRTTGLSEEAIDQVRALADERGYPLFIEADGSRQLPLKAPAEYEPVIPEWVNCVAVLVGLSGLGAPLTEEWVHRPERFIKLSGLAMGDKITVEALAKVLRNPAGGLKEIPSGARRVAILNQADTAEKQALAQRLAQQLLPTYQAVLVAALQNNTSPEDQVKACYEPVAGILLAAGGSRRLGQPKQLLSWHNQPLVRHIACTGLEAGLNPLIVITGAYHDEVQAALADLPVQIIHNPAWQEGQSTSLRAGLSALPSYMGAAVFLLSDQPYLTSSVIHALRDLHASTLAPAIVPLVEDRRTNPVLFDCTTFGDLMQTSGDVGGRALFNRYPVTYLPWLDENLLIDIDTPQDVDRLYGSASLVQENSDPTPRRPVLGRGYQG